jgi:hypothetical protein
MATRSKTKTKRRLQRGCGKCKKTRCKHQKQRGGCGTCVGGGKGKQMGGTGMVDNVSDLTTGVSGMFTNVFRGFQGQPPITFPSF